VNRARRNLLEDVEEAGEADRSRGRVAELDAVP
jgi:hypothetical protein